MPLYLIFYVHILCSSLYRVLNIITYISKFILMVEWDIQYIKLKRSCFLFLKIGVCYINFVAIILFIITTSLRIYNYFNEGEIRVDQCRHYLHKLYFSASILTSVEPRNQISIIFVILLIFGVLVCNPWWKHCKICI